MDVKEIQEVTLLDNLIDAIEQKIILNRIIFDGVKPSIEGIDRMENYFYMQEILDNNISRFISCVRTAKPHLMYDELGIIDISEDVIEDILVSY